MSKQGLIHLIDETLINIHNYNWTLYLFKLDKRSKENPYLYINCHLRMMIISQHMLRIYCMQLKNIRLIL